ncbi:MAG: IS481 family transposase, partial [Verrucomicrobiota bacterium]
IHKTRHKNGPIIGEFRQPSRHLSTAESIRLIETFGIETPDGLTRAPAGTLNKTTVNRYLRQWGYDRTTLSRQPAAVRFQAEQSNECWQFDLSPSDLKHIKKMRYLGIEVRTHLPSGSDGRRVTARAKGKVERPFRKIKEMHETLYHFHEPEDEANAWLLNFLARYNAGEHRHESHSRMDDWLQNLPASGVRAMCGWDRFCTFAREPERRKVGPDARVSASGVLYEVDPDLAGEEVVLWWGLFDQELYVEKGEKRFGPYAPVGGPIPLNHYRSFKKTRTQARADRIEELAGRIGLPRAAMEDRPELAAFNPPDAVPVKAFEDPDPFQEFNYPNPIAAKRAISHLLGMPLAKLPPEQLGQINAIVAETLNKQEVIARIRACLNPTLEENRRVE